MAPDFSRRSKEKELIDNTTTITEADSIRNLKELDTFNRLTGSIRRTIKLLKPYIPAGKPLRLVDIGCGGGEFLISLDNWSRKYNRNIKLTGIDNNQLAVDYIRERTKLNVNILIINSGYKEYLIDPGINPHIIHCSLFLHHLEREEIIELITIAHQMNAILIINDLIRTAAAWYGARFITTIFNGTSLARNDGPLSVLKGFRQSEIDEMVTKAGSTVLFWKTIPFFRFIAIIAP